LTFGLDPEFHFGSLPPLPFFGVGHAVRSGLGPALDVREPCVAAARAPRLDWERVVAEADDARSSSALCPIRARFSSTHHRRLRRRRIISGCVAIVRIALVDAAPLERASDHHHHHRSSSSQASLHTALKSTQCTWLELGILRTSWTFQVVCNKQTNKQAKIQRASMSLSSSTWPTS
jgi:hypothetical protein